MERSLTIGNKNYLFLNGHFRLILHCKNNAKGKDKGRACLLAYLPGGGHTKGFDES